MRGFYPPSAAALRTQPPGLRAGGELVADQLVRPGRPVAEDRARVARVDDLLDAEPLGGAEGRAHRVEPLLDVGPQRRRVLRGLELAPVGGLDPALDGQRAPVAT